MLARFTIKPCIHFPEGKEYTFRNPGTLLIGRGLDCDLIIPNDRTISRKQASVEFNLRNSYITSIGTKTPVKVNGCIINRDKLKDGDTIEIGFMTLHVHLDFSAPIPEKTVLCPECGKSFTIMETEDTPPCCDECMQSRQEKVKTAPVEPGEIHCSECQCNIKPSNHLTPLIMQKGIFLCKKCMKRQFSESKKLYKRYLLLKELGKGGNGTVYLVFDEATSTLQVLKAFYSGRLRHSRIRETLIRGIRMNKDINHPNVVQLFDHYEDKQTLYTTMEYMPDGDLTSYLKNHSNLSEQKVIELFKPVLSGLGHVHSRRIVHRDLKPENILLRRESGQLHVKVTDFDFAKIYIGEDKEDRTYVDGFKGSFLYSSPEQFLDCLNADHRADIFSAGMLLYYMLTGKQGYLDDDDQFPNQNDYIRYITSHRIVPLEKRLPSVTPEVQKAFQKATAKDREDRFQSTEEFLDALR